MSTFFKCREQGYIDQARHCLLRAITADPKDVTLRGLLARLYVELGDYQKAAVTYEQVHQLCHENVDPLKAAAKVCFCFETTCTSIQFFVNNPLPLVFLLMIISYENHGLPIIVML